MRPFAFSLTISALCCFLVAQDVPAPVDSGRVRDYPEGVGVISYPSRADESEQPALFWKPLGEKKAPLLVALHTWSGDYRQGEGEAAYARWCQQAGWVFVHPHFRGPNRTPEAMGSDLAVADVLSVIEYAKTQANIDEDRIYGIGVSGGGHMALLMAGRAPEVWAGISAWCAISDIAEWHCQCVGSQSFGHYARDIEKALGGPPAPGAETFQAARHRSPVAWLHRAAEVNLDINHGIHDGRKGSVPFSHALLAWNAAQPDASSHFFPEFVELFYRTQTPPDDGAAALPDPLYGTRQPIFRRASRKLRVTLFDGGHEIIHHAALNWLAAQRRGADAVWEVKPVLTLESSPSESGK